MQTFLANLTLPLAHVVHIGAGTGEGVPAWREAGAKRITLIEGDPETAERLEAQIGTQDGVRVVQAVVSGDVRERAFRRVNFPDLNSLRRPTGLKELFPGLKTLSTELAQPVDPAELIAPLDLSEQGSNLLLIEAPGEALGILEALAAADLLLRFDRIQLSEARAPLYDQAPPAAEILAYLVAAGFSAAFEDDPGDPERPLLLAEIDRAALVRKRQFEAMTAKRADEIAGLRGELAVARGETARVVKQLAGVQAKTGQQAGQQVGQLQDQIADLNSQLAGTRAELAEATGQLTAQVAQIEALETALKEACADGGLGSERGAEVSKSANTTIEHRLGQAREEMLKAEGQINLIRDLLLHGARL